MSFRVRDLLITVALCAFMSTTVFAQSATVDITLHPAGSFKVKTTDVRGFVSKKGDAVQAQNIIVGLKDLDTGISLRTTHTKRHLEVDKYPEAILVKAKGSGGKGVGIVKIRGIEKKVTGTYKIKGSEFEAEFPIKLSDYGITDIKYMGVGVGDEATVHVTVPVK